MEFLDNRDERVNSEAERNHEIRNHIQLLISSIQLLEGGRLEEESRKKYWQILRRHAMEILEISNRTLEEHGLRQAKAKKEIFGIRDVLRGCLEAIEPAAKKRNITLLEDIEEDISVHSDPKMLERMLDNLLSNAVKFNREKGYIHLAAHRNEAFVDILVSDTGEGMEEEKLKTLFSQDEEEKRRGHGFGLPLAAALAEKIGGSIFCKSERQKGTTFLIRLPRRAEA